MQTGSFWDSHWLEIWSNHLHCMSLYGTEWRERGFFWGGTTWLGDFKCREVKTGFCRNRSMQTGSSGTLIGWKSGQTTYVRLWDRMEGAWLRTQGGRFHYRWVVNSKVVNMKLLSEKLFHFSDIWRAFGALFETEGRKGWKDLGPLLLFNPLCGRPS